MASLLKKTKVKLELLADYDMLLMVENEITTHFCIEKIPNKSELQDIAQNYLPGIRTEDFINIYRKCADKPYSFIVIDNTLASDNPIRLRKNLFKYDKNHGS